jgi:hypothetical protein
MAHRQDVGCGTVLAAVRRQHRDASSRDNVVRMRFETDDRVRLLSTEDGVPAGTEGIVRGFNSAKNTYMVQFGGYGMHDIPEASVEATEPPS